MRRELSFTSQTERWPHPASAFWVILSLRSRGGGAAHPLPAPPAAPTPSRHLMIPHNLRLPRDPKEHLAKAKDYAEAHKMKLKSDALEAWELEKWRNRRQADLCQRESKFKHAKAQVGARSFPQAVRRHASFFGDFRDSQTGRGDCEKKKTA